jgi:erythromycin esterase-like protein/predicted phosphoribosyltransferase
MASEAVFRDRREAGRVLAARLDRYRGRPDVLVLGLPRGGVPVAFEVAAALGAALDVFLVRKLGVPGREELAMGAIASGGVVVVNDDVVRALGLPPAAVQQVTEREAEELLRREAAYREGRPPPDVADRTVILVDDGLATGSSMRAAVLALRRLHPAHSVVAVPAAPQSTCEELAAEVDEVVCATTPSPFFAVGQSYWDFSQTTDEEVRRLLREAHSPASDGAARLPTEPATMVRLAMDPLFGAPSDYDAVLERVGDAHFVLIGEASHGTHEFYAERAAITRRLIEEKGFSAVAVEADWPDAYRVDRYVRGRGDDADAEEALRGFERFPTWMWRNADVLDFVGWLRDHNAELGDERARAGFYGLDLYSLLRSIHEVITYLEKVDPDAAALARARYACFDHVAEDARMYGYGAAFGAGKSCQQEVIDQLVDLTARALDDTCRDGLEVGDECFSAEQNARTVKAAEEYYRTMFAGGVVSWNLRDRHMTDTLDGLALHLSRRQGRQAKVVIWAHNSHLGDARATELGSIGELNVGQLVRERHPGDCFNIGFTTYTGTVTAASDWDEPAERKHVRPALGDSVEALFHAVSDGAFMVPLVPGMPATEELRAARLERAIGVIYRPETERSSHYFQARLADQFDLVIHIDETRAVEPLERTPRWDEGEPPLTYPYAV